MIAACAVTAGALVALAGSLAASSGDTGWTSYTPDHDGRLIVVAGGTAGERHAALTEAEAEAQGLAGNEPTTPGATSEACALFRASDNAADAVDLANMAEPIADNAIQGPDLAVRRAALAIAAWAGAHGLAEVPATLVKPMRGACYVWETSPAGVADSARHSGDHSYSGL